MIGRIKTLVRPEVPKKVTVYRTGEVIGAGLLACAADRRWELRLFNDKDLMATAYGRGPMKDELTGSLIRKQDLQSGVFPSVKDLVVELRYSDTEQIATPANVDIPVVLFFSELGPREVRPGQAGQQKFQYARLAATCRIPTGKEILISDCLKKYSVEPNTRVLMPVIAHVVAFQGAWTITVLDAEGHDAYFARGVGTRTVQEKIYGDVGEKAWHSISVDCPQSSVLVKMTGYSPKVTHVTYRRQRILLPSRFRPF